MSKGALRSFRTGKTSKTRTMKNNVIRDPKKGYSRANARLADRVLLDSDFWL